MFFLLRFLRRIIQIGDLTIIGPNGARHTLGDGQAPPIVVHLKNRWLPWKILFNPSLYAGEAYMNGALTFEKGDIGAFITLFKRNVRHRSSGTLQNNISYWIRRALRTVFLYMPVFRARRDVAHHYDLNGELYALFLDDDRQYSCAYFRHRENTLEEAQENKKALLARKLLLQPGQRVIDIGSGWGGLALFLNKTAGVKVTGITLSQEQYTASCERARQEGVEGEVDFLLRDYREVTGKFDRLVSVGMFEHVGLPQYPVFFRKAHDLLTDDGIGLLHTIGRSEGPGVTNPWILKYIFPGGYSSALSEIVPAIEQAGFYITDIEVLRMHYAYTIEHWIKRFQANRAHIAALFDERFCRMWEFYLEASIAAFADDDHVVFQIQFAKRQMAVPLTRDYLCDALNTPAPATGGKSPASR